MGKGVEHFIIFITLNFHQGREHWDEGQSMGKGGAFYSFTFLIIFL